MITFPSNAVEAGQTPTSEGTVVTQDGSAAILFTAALVYHQTSYGLAMATQQRTNDLMRTMQPVNDAQMVEWINAWDEIQKNAARQQELLTRSWASISVKTFGVPLERHAEIQVPEGRVEPLVRWLQSSDIPDLDPTLAQEAQALLDRIEAKTASLADLAHADRIPSLHSPVLDLRTRLALDEPVDLAIQGVSGHTSRILDAGLRTNEGDVISNIKWPTFKDGTAMLAKRLPNAGACGWCRVVATRLYSLATYSRSAAWHNACRCSMALVTEAEAKAYNAALGKSADYYSGARAIGLWDGNGGSGMVSEPFDPVAAAKAGYVSTDTRAPRAAWGTGVRPARTSASPRAAAAASNQRVGAVTPERASLVDRQLAGYEDQVANGTATDWTRSQIEKLRRERESLRRALGA